MINLTTILSLLTEVSLELYQKSNEKNLKPGNKTCTACAKTVS